MTSYLHACRRFPAQRVFSLACLIAALAVVEIGGISVPTGKLTPITPAKVTPRPTYHPPSANPAPVHEYTFDNPEPAPLNPSWLPVPVKYLNVLRPNSIFYVPVRIPNPAARQPTYYTVALKEQTKPAEETGTTYQEESNSVYQTQQPTAPVYQSQQPTAGVYQSQQPTAGVYQAQQPTAGVYQAQQPTAGVYQSQQPNAGTYQAQQPTPTVYQKTQQPTVIAISQQQFEPANSQNQQPNVTAYQTQQPNTGAEVTAYPKEADTTSYQKEAAESQEFGAKISPKPKWKPNYYLPKSQYKQATKAGYPKKAVAAPSQKYYYYYPIETNAQ